MGLLSAALSAEDSGLRLRMTIYENSSYRMGDEDGRRGDDAREYHQ